jgi:hypothetical protein
MAVKTNKRQLKIGTSIEMEHTTSRRLARKIASDHLREFPGAPYYTELIKMEKKLKKMVRGKKK